MSMTWNEARKCLKSLMNVLIIKEGDKYRPAKDTSRQDAYRALYEIQEALGTRRIEREEELLENMQDLELAISIFLTRGEIIGVYEEAAVAIGLVASTGDREAARTYEIIRAGLNALRTPTREQVEKVWRGQWIDCSNGWMCSRCENDNTYAKPFCPSCGAAMTDEAVDIVMKRLEALKDE